LRQGKISSIDAQWRFYGLSVLGATIALLLTRLMVLLLDPIALPLFYGVVALSACRGGLGPGLGASAHSALTSLYFIFNPVSALGIPIAGLQTPIQKPVGSRNAAEQQRCSVRPMLASPGKLKRAVAMPLCARLPTYSIVLMANEAHE
jgi:hypothetical protein